MTDLSIVVASQDAEATIGECLSSLEAQNQNGAVEIIVVDNSRDRSAKIVAKRFSSIQLFQVSAPSLIPELWARGAKHATGEVVAFTTAHCIPDSAWVKEILRHHESTYAGVGGAIENLQPAPLIQWAIYFCRYSGYMLPFSAHTVAQIPGDNAAYKRWILKEYADLIKTAFWETVVNDRLLKEGHALLLTPSIRVYHGRSFGMWQFCRQRMVLGHIFGTRRASATSPVRRFLYVASSPLVPLVFLGKITRQVFGRGRHRLSFVRSLPLLIVFVLCWSVGEFLGYLQEAFRSLTGARTVAKADQIVHR